MSGLVERLAKKWEEGPCYYPDAAEDIARWAVLAIAEELEASGEWDHYAGAVDCHANAATWLREQAGGEPGEGRGA